VRAAITAAVVVAVAVAAAGCGDDAPKLQSSDTPEDVVAFGISELGPATAKVPPSMARELAVQSMASAGIPASEANCVLALGIPLVGGESAFDQLTVRKIAAFGKTAQKAAVANPDKALGASLKAQLAACVSTASADRKKARKLPADFDAAAAREVGAVVAEQNARAVGLTAKEARCYADVAYRALSLSTVGKLVTGAEQQSASETRDVIDKCMTTERIDALAPGLDRRLLKEQADRARDEQQLQQEINQAGTPTTTTTVAR
jgi:hypothetical protein